MVTGDSVHYVAGGGTITPRLADDILYRHPHPEPVRKPAGLNWDQLTPTCPSCQTKSGQIDATGLCPGCRGDEPVNPIQANVTSNRHGNFQQLDAVDVTARFTAPTQTPQGEETPSDVGAPEVPSPSITTGTAMPSTPRPAAPTVRAKIRRVSPHDVVVTLCSTTDPIDPVAVAALLNDLLSALATQTPAATPSTAAAGTTSEGRTRVGKPARPSDTPHFETFKRGPRRDKINLPSPDVEDAYIAGATLCQLADHYDVSPPTISRHLDEHGVVRRKQKVDYTPQLIGDVRRLYVDDQLNQDQVAERLGLTTKVVQTAMDKGGIPARESAVERSKRGVGHAIKIPRADHPSIVERYQAGESAPSIALTYDASATSIYPILRAAGITEFHGNKTLAAPGHDHSAPLRARIEALGVTSSDIKRWALHQGLIEVVRRGVVPTALVDAYAAAHPQREAS